VVVATATVKVNVAVTDSTEYVESAALVTVSEHVPAVLAVTTPDVSVQVAVPDVTEDVTAPVPEPPVVSTVIPETVSPEFVDTARGVCVLFPNVTVVALDETVEYMPLAAFVAVTVHIPGDVARRALPPVTEQPAVPEVVATYVTAPLPEPPEVARVRSVPYVPLVDVNVRFDCET
jgi:hypothetical protein